MQFNDKVSVIFNSYNSYGEEVEGKTEQIVCRIMYLKRDRKRGDNADVKDFDAQLIVPYKSYSPYPNLMTDDSLMMIVESILYNVINVEAIRGFSGKVKYYSINLREADES